MIQKVKHSVATIGWILKSLLRNTAIMSAETRQAVDGFGVDIEHFREDITEIKRLVMKLDKKVDSHMKDEAHDFRTTKIHIKEIVEILRDLEK